MSFFSKWRLKTKGFKKKILVIYLAMKDDKLPWYTKLLAALIIGYAFSPIDLIPDFIPILGYLDDLLLLPIGIMLLVKLIPKEVLLEYERKLEQMEGLIKPKSWLMAYFIIFIWIITGILLLQLATKR